MRQLPASSLYLTSDPAAESLFCSVVLHSLRLNISFNILYKISGITLILMLFGMECTKVFLQGEKAFWKVKIMRLAAIGMSIENKWDFTFKFIKLNKVLLLTGIMLMYISSVYAAQISFEYYYDQYSPADIGSEVTQLKFLAWNFQKTFNLVVLLQPKINIDKVRYEWGGCIYAGWCISGLEIIFSGLVWHFRGFKENRLRLQVRRQVSLNLVCTTVYVHIQISLFSPEKKGNLYSAIKL